jgi:hypothetical protein
MLDPTQQAPLQLTMGPPSPDPVTGTVVLTYTPNAVASTDDPSVMLVSSQSSTRSVDFTFPSNATSPQLSLPDALVQAGTVAGTIQLTTPSVKTGDVSTPSDASFTITVPRLPPIITSVVILNRTLSGFVVEVTGYSTTRDITGATFQFAAASGADLLTLELQPGVTPVFTSYYQSPGSDAVGSAFVYDQPFIVTQGTSKAVASITVTLSNSAGTSAPATAQ